MILLTSAKKAEERVDKEFFTNTKPAIESKMTKEERRQIKFAARRGEDITKLSVDEIKKRAEKKPKRTPKPVEPQIKPGYRGDGYKFDMLDQ